jgi:hypothetical protein
VATLTHPPGRTHKPYPPRLVVLELVVH